MSNQTEAQSIPETTVESLLDKKAWHDAVEREVTAAHESGQPLSVLFVDADRFKSVNDELGHNTGDAVIEDMRSMINLVSSNVRTSKKDADDPRPLDIVAVSPINPLEDERLIHAQGGHIGGDEFAVLAHTDKDGADVIANRLRAAFSDYIDSPQNDKLRNIGVGLAIGSAELKEGMDSSQLLREADKAMYQDKLARLRELAEHAQHAFQVALYLLKYAGVEPRDVPKYVQKYTEQ